MNNKLYKGYWMHPSWKDVCIKILEIEESKAKFQWYCLGYTGNPWPLPTPIDTLDLNQDSAKKLINIDDNLNKPRKKPGPP